MILMTILTMIVGIVAIVFTASALDSQNDELEETELQIIRTI